MQAGEIHLAAFPFGDIPRMKLRPVLLLTARIATTNELLVSYVSSVVPATLLPSDLIIDPSVAEHRSTGVKVVSVLRLHKLATIHITSVRRRLGQLSAASFSQVRDKLRVLLAL
jgi:mRNA interferase MazF